MSTVRRGLQTARAEALFTSDLPLESVTREQVDAAIQSALRLHGGVVGCAAQMAAAYGERPETAVPRMRWALSTVSLLYPPAWRHPVRALRARVEHVAEQLHTASDAYAERHGLTFEPLPWGRRRYHHPVMTAELAAPARAAQPKPRWSR